MLRRAPRWIVAAILLLAAALPWLLVARTLGNARPVRSSGTPEAIVWADRVFGSERELAAWLRARGGSYDAWAASHPALHRILSHEPAAPATTRAATATTPAAAPTTTGAAAQPAPADAAPAASSSGRDVAGFVKSVVWLLAKIGAIVIALALLAFALGPERLLARLSTPSGLAAASVEVRIAAAAAALSLATGIFAAYLLG